VTGTGFVTDRAGGQGTGGGRYRGRSGSRTPLLATTVPRESFPRKEWRLAGGKLPRDDGRNKHHVNGVPLRTPLPLINGRENELRIGGGNRGLARLSPGAGRSLSRARAQPNDRRSLAPPLN